MHAYLVIGQKDKVENTVKKQALKIKATLIEFPLNNVNDTKMLSEYCSLVLAKKTVVYINSIDNASTEALNAFLKILEEPQANLFFILTASNMSSVLPTILSRCQIISTTKIEVDEKDYGEIVEFLKMETGTKLSFLDKIKEREQALDFLTSFIFSCHRMLLKTDSKHENITIALTASTNTYNALEKNGNVSLQLTNFVVSLK